MDDAHQLELDKLRQQIDALDYQMLEILARRLDVVRQVGEFKNANGIAPLDEQRWQEVLSAGQSKAKLLKLPPDFVTNLYELIHECSLDIETDTK